MKHHKKRKRSIVIGIIILILLLLPFCASRPDDFELNQFFIGDRAIKNWSFNLKEIGLHLRSSYAMGLHELFGKKIDPAIVNYEEPKEFLTYLWSRFPSYAVVHPTETYYYYQVDFPNTTISGNIRLLDAGEGIIRLGYFETSNPHSPRSEKWVGAFGPDEGVEIKTISDFIYDVTFAGRTIRFNLSDFIFEPPKKLTLLPEEEFVTQILDESGIRFFLLFNNETNSFYFVLNEEIPVNENILEFSDRYYYGETTKFVYYYDQNFNRKIIVGINKGSVFWNDYFDGLFDQVPPRLPLKEKLLAAYPYVAYRGGIDEHGNFNQISGTRVAISPYYQYDDLNTLLSYLARCDESEGKSTFWSCLTYEWKKDFHKTLPPGYTN